MHCPHPHLQDGLGHCILDAQREHGVEEAGMQLLGPVDAGLLALGAEKRVEEQEAQGHMGGLEKTRIEAVTRIHSSLGTLHGTYMACEGRLLDACRLLQPSWQNRVCAHNPSVTLA